MKNFRLDQHPKIGAGFQIPDGFFDDFSTQMMQQLPASKVIPLNARRHFWMAAAAVLVLGLTLPALDHFAIGNESAAENAALEHYLADQSSLTTDDIAEAMTMEDIRNLNVTYKIDDRQLEEAVSQTTDIQNYTD